MSGNPFDRKGGKVVNRRRRTVSDGFEWGVYAWRMPDGKVLGDADGNMLNVPSIRGDVQKMAAISRFVKEQLNIQGGEPYFMEGVMRLSEMEYEDQFAQMLDGKTPTLDLGSVKDDLKEKRRNGR